MVPAKIAFDQTVWAAIWNSIYFVVLGFLRLESPIKIFDELKATFWPMLTVRNSSNSLLSVLMSLYCFCYLILIILTGLQECLLNHTELDFCKNS